MRVAAAAGMIQARYEAGDISYPRTASRTLGAAGAVRVAALCRAPLHGMVEPVVDVVRKPHEAVHVLRVDMPGFAGVPQHLLPVEMRFLDRVARATVRAAVPLQVERPDTRPLPPWARELPWWRPGPDFPPEARSRADGCDLVVQAELFDFDAEEVAFEALARESLGRPSSIADHAIRAVERGFVDASGITALGHAALADVPPSLTLPGIAHAVEAVIEGDVPEGSAEGPPADLIERCFGVMPELAPRLRAALKRGEGGGDSEMKPAAESPAGKNGSEPSEAERAYWERRLTAAAETDGISPDLDRVRESPPAGDALEALAPPEAPEGEAVMAQSEAVQDLAATADETQADWTWLTPDAPPAPEEVGDELELEDDYFTSHAPRGPQPW